MRGSELMKRDILLLVSGLVLGTVLSGIGYGAWSLSSRVANLMAWAGQMEQRIAKVESEVKK